MQSSKIFVVLSILIKSILAQSECYVDDPCTLYTGGNGICTNIHECPSAIELLQYNVRPVLCGFMGLTPIVCCAKSEPPKPPKTPQNIAVLSPIASKPTELPEFVLAVSPPTAETTKLKPGEKSQIQCDKYAPPPPKPGDFGIAAVGGEESLAKEFPHMAALGYKIANGVGWYCGGGLISERYVLTAAHCLFHRDAGPVTFVRLGDLNIQDDADDAQPENFTILERIPHPDYRAPLVYNDIALLRLDRDVTFSDYIKPLCLQVEHVVNTYDPLTATGWGRTEFGGQTSDILIKVKLDYFTNEECNEVFQKNSKKRLPDGVIDSVQVCAGGRDERMDTCQGDSGGPLQTYSFKKKIFYLVGITSFGIACGTQGIPAVYTRISGYVDWIENIIWQNVTSN
uniref:Serine protease 2 n=1 Tax=Lasioderma serricorne TaxID=295660 RepID=A0A5Q0MUK0_9COLE|nr:serine protease 2 [Lasioderma serricorne]